MKIIIIITVLLLLFPTLLHLPPPDSIHKILDETKKYKEHKLLIAVIRVESEFKPDALSKKGARGLMQIMPIWDKELKEKGIISNKKDIFKIENNIKAGHYILTNYISKEKSVKKALTKYNGGGKKYLKKVGRFFQF